MICQNCGTQNTDNSRFCIKCGAPINANNNQFINDNNITSQTTNSTAKMNLSEYITIIFSILLKPYTALKDKVNNFDQFKNSAILSFVISLVAMLIILIKTIINTVRVTSRSFFSEAKTEWVWENLKEIDFIKVIGTNLLIFLAIIFAIACVYYIAGLIVKKQINFSRFLGIAAISVVPMLLSALVLSPLLTKIYEPLGMAITIIGAVYTIIITYEAINNELLLEGNSKYYFNLICLSILLIAGYYVYMKFFTASIGDLSDIFSMFG